MTSSPLESRQDRQRRAILRAFDEEEFDRATALACEHLVEFPDDEVVKGALSGSE